MEGTRSQYANQVALVLSGTTQIRLRVGRLGSQSGCLPNRFVIDSPAAKNIFRFLRFDWSGAGVGQADSCSFADLTLCDCQLRSHRGHRKVTDLPLELDISAAAAGRRNRDADFGEEFV